MDCNLTITDVACKVSMRVGRIFIAAGSAIPYTQPVVAQVDGNSVGHFVIAVVAGTLHDVIASTGAVTDVLSGVVSIQYI